MNVLIWKKCKEIRNSPMRVVAFIMLAVLFALAFVNLSGLQLNIILWAYPITMCFIAAFVLFNVDDIAQAILYRAMGIRMRSLWINNWAFISLLSFVTAGLIMLIYGIISSWDFDLSMVVNYLLSLPVIVALSALSTLHYKGNTKMEVLIASVFSIINLGMLMLPFILPVVHINNAAIAIIAILSMVGFIISVLYFSSNYNEDIVRNTEMFAKAYDDKFLGDE
jgi:hypothetical protein